MRPTCKYCHKEALYSFSGFLNNNRRDIQDPLFKFHIGIRCVQCEKWSGWVQQTPELMEYINGGVLIPPQKFPNTKTNDPSRITGTEESGAISDTSTAVR